VKTGELGDLFAASVLFTFAVVLKIMAYRKRNRL
jgi:hypothetical protein